VPNNPPAAVENGESEVRQRIIAAARECFQRYGPRRTTMEDVAAVAGIARPALYRYVSSRDEIVEAVILQRIEELAEDLRPLFDPSTSFAEAFVEVSMAAVNAARLDPELQALFETTTGTRIIQVMAGPNPGFHEFVKAFFKDAFAAARAAGDLRGDVSDDAMVDWIRGVYMMMILREDLDAEQEREMVLNFLLPSLSPGNHAAIDLTERAAKTAKRRKVSRGPAASRS
jgi:AcrR family transcriptional regulator